MLSAKKENENSLKRGLCGNCVHARILNSDRGSTFVQCKLSFSDARFAKYPRLPVLTCSGYAKCSDGE
jgi:hypothetical protein